MRTWWLVNASALIASAVVVFITIGTHNQTVENNREWVDVGTIVSLSPIPGSYNRCHKTEIKTQEYTFVVDTIVGVCKSGTRVYWSGEFVYLEGTKRTYTVFESEAKSRR